MSDEAVTIIIDNGSGMVKAGLAGEEQPRAVFPSVVGRPKHQQSMHGTVQKSEYVGDEAMQKKGILNLTYPIAAGIVESWEDMEKVWHHTFYNELRVAPEEAQGVVMTEAPRCPKLNREKMVTVMFETFQVKAMYVAIQAVMSLYAAGRTTGLVCDSGDGVSHTIPVFEGFALSHGIEKMEIAGRVLNDYMQKLLLEIGESLTSSAELEIVRDIKEKHCFIAQDYEKESKEATSSSTMDASYTMPDKRVITIPAHVRMTCPELLFNPNLNGKTCASIQNLTWKSVQASDVDVRRDLCKNIILSGGTTMYEGLPDRLKNEIVSLAPAGSEIRVIATADRKYSVWRGASTLASLSTFASSWITHEDYEENGAAIVHRKCS
jgi:actin